MTRIRRWSRSRRIFACILTPRSLVWKCRYWNSPQWKVCAIHIVIVLHILLMICIRNIRYAYVTHTTTCVMHTSYACIRYAFGDTGFNAGPSPKARVWTLKSCAYEHFSDFFIRYSYVLSHAVVWLHLLLGILSFIRLNRDYWVRNIENKHANKTKPTFAKMNVPARFCC